MYEHQVGNKVQYNGNSFGLLVITLKKDGSIGNCVSYILIEVAGIIALVGG
jgi:hypothetical protein